MSEIDVDVRDVHWYAPSEYLRSQGDAGLVMFEPMIARAVMRGDIDAARRSALELALWRDSRMTADEWWARQGRVAS